MIILILLLLGLCFGSFINALVWRLHEQTLPTKKRAASLKDLSIARGRSMCPHCKHTLGVWDLLPVISWVMLKGHCRYCKHPISPQYPLVEAAMAALFVATYVFWPYSFDSEGIFLLITWLVALIGLMALFIYDLRWMLLPNKIVFPLIAGSALQVAVVAVVFDGGLQYVLQAAFSLIIAGGIFFVLFQVSDGKWIGGGDVKLGYALGLFLASPGLAMLLLFIASLLGVLASLPGLVSKKLSGTSRIPFGPFLILAAVIVMLFGQQWIDWYTGLFM